MTKVESAGLNIVISGDLQMKTHVPVTVKAEQASPECRKMCRLTFDDGTILQGCWTACENWQFRLLRKGEKVIMLHAGARGYLSCVTFSDGLRWGFLSTDFYNIERGVQ